MTGCDHGAVMKIQIEPLALDGDAAETHQRPTSDFAALYSAQNTMDKGA
jgi:hypothetical protein